MKKLTKRIMALMLSLLMLLGCVPSFINEASADAISVACINLVTSGLFSSDGITFAIDYEDPDDEDKYSLDISIRDYDTNDVITDTASDGRRYGVDINATAKAGYTLRYANIKVDGMNLSNAYTQKTDTKSSTLIVYTRDYVSVDYTEPESIDDVTSMTNSDFTIYAGQGCSYPTGSFP